MATTGAGPVLARLLTPSEVAHLDRLREWLEEDGVDVDNAASLDARWGRLLATHPADGPAPAGVAAAIGIAVGDLLLRSVPGATWMMCPGPDGATPGVVADGRVHRPVLAVLDAHARWRVRAADWTVDYVRRAAQHLAAPPEEAAPATEPAAPEPSAAELVVPELVDPAPLDPQPLDPEVADTAAVEPEVADTAGPPAPLDALSPAWRPPTPAPATPAWAPVHAPSPAAAPLPEADVVTSSTPVVAPASTLTPEDLPHRPSAQVQDLALRALEHALEQAVAHPEGAAPFVLVRDDAGVHLTTFPHGDAGTLEAREHARRCGLAAAAVGWTSRADAVRPYPRAVVDASAAGEPGIRVAHAFLHDAAGGREIGGPEVVGQAAPVL
ncbi:hypothetical protein [Cellulomonas shaoxiangyii]|uniref:DUF3806 domain-containing protein n=1 Tax=Cellulomonas shaoxiangyii TaxID=2566013 RepID=A0A4P7SKC5_9CELL|nr:hypothetical protein [Cellulomonas shaoxiangyii]QCB94652.1 hypothetical protein E5225_14890 [Cellulomonas shaoxiangyii]TGY84705.1 hypothetical protein E5226_09885 [Cellulomonas shaoxiangyii]